MGKTGRLPNIGRRSVPDRIFNPIPAVWTPVTPGYVLFLDGDRDTYSDAGGTTPATNGGAVKAWKDQSGNAHNGSTANAGNILNTSDVNGHNSVSTATGAAQMDISFTLNQPLTVIMVINHTWHNAGDLIFNNPSANFTLLHQSATVGDFRMFATSGAEVTGTGFTDSTWCVMTSIWNGAASSLQINSNTGVIASLGGRNPGGISILPSATIQKLAAVLVYPSALSGTDLTNQINDCKTRFGIV